MVLRMLSMIVVLSVGGMDARRQKYMPPGEKAAALKEAALTAEIENAKAGSMDDADDLTLEAEESQAEASATKPSA